MTLTDGNVVYYSFDDGTATDLSGNGNNGTISNATSTTTAKLGGKAFYFDGGSNTYIKTPSGLITDTGTINIWFKNDDTSQTNVCIYDCTKIGVRDYVYLKTYDGSTRDYLAMVSDSYIIVSGTGTIDTNWHMGTIRWTSTDFEVFIDGVSQGTNSGQGTPANAYAVFLAMNGDGDSPAGQNMFKGYLDEFGLWNRWLSDSEISQLYNSGNGYNPYSSTPSGWSNKINSITPGKVDAISSTDISKINGV